MSAGVTANAHGAARTAAPGGDIKPEAVACGQGVGENLVDRAVSGARLDVDDEPRRAGRGPEEQVGGGVARHGAARCAGVGSRSKR
jgi:hypothetical protein